jgi:hypothetical protein
VARHWFEVDLDDASIEHGARMELRVLAGRPHRGNESAAQLITADRPLWRADVFDRLGKSSAGPQATCWMVLGGAEQHSAECGGQAAPSWPGRIVCQFRFSSARRRMRTGNAEN